jgi:hypothetical protein
VEYLWEKALAAWQTTKRGSRGWFCLGGEHEPPLWALALMFGVGVGVVVVGATEVAAVVRQRWVCMRAGVDMVRLLSARPGSRRLVRRRWLFLLSFFGGCCGVVFAEGRRRPVV